MQSISLDTLDAKSQPKTKRGRDTQERILAAAWKLVSEHWVHDLPFTELAVAAKVARASLLHVYPHWRDVLYDLLTHELSLLEDAYETADSLKRKKPAEKAFVMLRVLLDRAEKTGRLYPNLRSEMFTWHGKPGDADLTIGVERAGQTPETYGTWLLFQIGDIYMYLESLLGVVRPKGLKQNEFPPVPLGECLVNFALDLAAGRPSYWSTFEERRQTLRSTIDVVAAGLSRPRKRRMTRR